MTRSFLQSVEWEEIQRRMGRETRRVGEVLLIRHALPLGLNYLYCPRPSIGFRDEGLGISIFNTIVEIAKTEKSIFIKIDPIHPLYPIPYTLYPGHPIQPRETVIIDLSLSEEELLAKMHEKTRYNIRLAERKGLRITNCGLRITDGCVERFWRMLQETAARGRFSPHPPEYYEKMLAIRSENFYNELFFAEYRDKVVAAALINFYRSPVWPAGRPTSPDGAATYLHGASSREYKEAMAPHLLHWRIIQEAKKRGFAAYDFWGIDAQRWPGLTRFKLGFGGEAVQYPSSMDIVYHPARYWMYRLGKAILRAW